MTLLAEVYDDTGREQESPVFETERLILRAPRYEDARAIATLINDYQIAANLAGIPYPYGLDDAKRFIASVNKIEGEECFAIIRDGRLIGGCGLHPREGGLELGYWLGAPYWGLGYATEIARAMVDHAFGDRGYETLQAGARISNPASRRVLEKCGFQWAGVRLQRIRAINSAGPFDRFRLDRGLWASLKSWGRVQRRA